YLLSSTIIGILAQRLVRAACPYCRQPVPADPAVLKEMKTDGISLEGDKVYEVRGCDQCGNTGYWGRVGIFELLKVNDEIQRLIMEKKDANVIKDRARQMGMRTLREDGWVKVKEGVTTVSEVIRATQEEQVV
ncbi:MAG TPA: type II secretion system protein GspE, partial [Thermodesulfobacteriota bacterium]|nr:type II secretion system protein GspE [Thermodesulfobacteriota bacterium]